MTNIKNDEEKNIIRIFDCGDVIITNDFYGSVVKQEEIPDKKDETTPVTPSENDSEHLNTGDTTNTGM